MNVNETITEATFEAEVLKSEQPVLVVFGTLRPRGNGSDSDDEQRERTFQFLMEGETPA
jgi:hypothetical protein